MKKINYLLIPLMGAFIGMLSFIPYLLMVANYQNNSIISVFWGLFKILPIIFFIFALISYIICFTIGWILIVIKTKYQLSANMFWLLTFFSSLMIGLIVGQTNYYYEMSGLKYLTIVIGISLGGLFTSSLYSVLSGEKLPKNKLF